MWHNRNMAVIKDSDILAGEHALRTWKNEAARQAGRSDASIGIAPKLPRKDYAMAVRYSLFLMEKLAPGPGVELRIAPYAAVKILEGPKSDPHNLTPPDVIELEPAVWLRMACGFTTWQEEKDAGHISAVGVRDDLSQFLPLPL